MADTPGAQALLAPDSALPEIPHGGTVWKLGRPDQDARARLEKLAIKVAVDQVRALKGVLDPGAYQELFGDVTRNLGRYATWRDRWQEVVFDPANGHLFLWSLLQAHHPAVTAEQVLRLIAEAPEEAELALAQVLPDFFQVLLSAALELVPAADRAGAERVAAGALAALRARPTRTRPSAPTP